MAEPKKPERMQRLVIQLRESERSILDRINESTGASYSEIVRRLIAKEGTQ